MPLEEKVRDAIDRGRKIGTQTDTFRFKWFSHFGFKDDPFFQRPVTLDDETQKLFVDRYTEIERVAELIGIASVSEKGVFKIAVVGPDGVGKKSIAYMVDDVSKSQGLTSLVYDVANDCPRRQQDVSDTRVPGIPVGDYDYVILENARNPEKVGLLIKDYENQTKRSLLFIVLLSPEHFSALLKVYPGLFDQEIYIDAFSTIETEAIIESRIKAFSLEEGERITVAALSEISNNALGIPKFALEITCQSFQIAFKRRKPLVEIEDVKEALSRFSRLNLEDLKLTTREEDIIRYLLRTRSTDPSGLQNELDISHNVSWKYLEKLHERSLLDKRYSGRRTFFSLNPFIAAQLQMKLYSRGE